MDNRCCPASRNYRWYMRLLMNRPRRLSCIAPERPSKKGPAIRWPQQGAVYAWRSFLRYLSCQRLPAVRIAHLELISRKTDHAGKLFRACSARRADLNLTLIYIERSDGRFRADSDMSIVRSDFSSRSL